MEKINAHFPSAVLMRQVFRKFKDSMQDESDWKQKLMWMLSNAEWKKLEDFLGDKECVYAYKALHYGYEKRPIKPEKESKMKSLLSRLCYKINQCSVDEFMKRKELNFAFYCALE
jgi:hypothetical protein